MKVLFICSGNKKEIISPIVTNQGKSLEEQGVQIDYFPITGKGFKGFPAHYFRLRKQIKKNKYDVLHAHYSYYGFFTSMVVPFHRKIIVSLMGGIPKTSVRNRLVRIFARISWKFVIVKSERVAQQISLKNCFVIPNGVNLNKFNYNVNKELLRKELGLESKLKYILFLSHPDRKDKNFPLCREAVENLNDPSIKILTLFDKSHNEVAKYILSGDVLMLTSKTEGSPNAIKEAMAAGCPIVATDVGDVRWVVGNTPGCYVLNTFSVEEATMRLIDALNYKEKTTGVNRIKELGLDAESIAKRIIKLYT